MITWDEFKKTVDAKIDELKISDRSPEIEYMDFSYPQTIDDIHVFIDDQNRLVIS